MQRVFLGLIVAAIAGCSSVGGGSGNAMGVRDVGKPDPNGQPQKFAATIRVVPYADERKMANPRKIGIGAENLSGLSGLHGTDILLEQDVAAMVTGAMNKRLEAAGYQVLEANSNDAMFELSGVVKELTYNVKSRDEVSISVESTLKENITGKVLWSGIVVENADRFAGVMGNSMDDIVNYLKKELGIVMQKTTDAISAVLVAQRPELFNVIPGTKPIPGVTVLSAPAVSAVPPAMPVASVAQGVLLVNTDPSRAKIYLGDVYYGLSPLRLEMEPGIRDVTARLHGYKNATEKVSVRKGETTEVELTLER